MRFHRGSRGRKGNYSSAELDTWRRRIARWRSRVDVYAYFNNDWQRVRGQERARAAARAAGRLGAGARLGLLRAGRRLLLGRRGAVGGLGLGRGFLAAGFFAGGFFAAGFLRGLPLRSRPRGSPRGPPSGPAPPSAASASGCTATSWPWALRSIRSSTRSRYSSRYLPGSKSLAWDSISCRAIASSRSVALTSSSGSSSRRSGGTSSSANSIVSIVSTSPAARIAVRYSF